MPGSSTFQLPKRRLIIAVRSPFNDGASAQMNHRPELLSPAGNWGCLRAAVANGADAVYFGLPRFNARLRAQNFTQEDLPGVMTYLHRRGVKGFVAFNTLVFTDELDAAAEQLRTLSAAGVDAIIVQDVGLVRLARTVTPDLPLHASTQMTITSPEGVRFARELGIERAVLARELSLREIKKFRLVDALPLEVFVHGAICVAYSGQCLTSESLGQRSANRGECAQACRMPYQLLVDGVLKELGDKHYLLSPQDLAAVGEIPALIELGVVSFKIEGRLKSPEYVAAVTQVYRRAIDAALEARAEPVSGEDRYQLEMTFSRGLFSGWMHGVNHQQLVGARYGKKRGPFVARVRRVGRDFVEIEQAAVPLQAGDGVVFDTGGDTNSEQGGRIYSVRGTRLKFKHRHIDFSRIKTGDRVWKTDDPALNQRLRKTFTGKEPEPRHRMPVKLRVSGGAGEPLQLQADASGKKVELLSRMPLQTARTAPLSQARLEEHLGRFGESAFVLDELRNELSGEVILPIGELNHLRRELLNLLERPQERRTPEISVSDLLRRLPETPVRDDAQLTVLCRTMEQLETAVQHSPAAVYVDFEDIRRYRDAVELVNSRVPVFLATPRIQKAGEQGFFKLIENAQPDGVLIRNLGAIEFFSASPLRKVGDFSLNVANPLSAEWFIAKELERLTISYDLNIEQVLALLGKCPPRWLELTIHQHMPMFHMEHCVFAAFLSEGTDHTNCGRPCDRHQVKLRDRVRVEHPLRADVGCRNTLFNASAQTGAQFFEALVEAGLRNYRLELLKEDAAQTQETLRTYQALLAGEVASAQLWRHLKAQSQLGVTRGTY